VQPLACVSVLLQPKPPLGMHGLFAAAATPPSRGGSGSGDDAAGGTTEAPAAVASAAMAAEFAHLVTMWDTLKLDKVLQGKAPVGCLPEFIVCLASLRSSTGTAAALTRRLEQLSVPGVTINGKALVGVPRLPNHLRGVLITHLHVLARLRSESLDLQTPAQLIEFLERDCGQLLTRLHAEWYEEGETLRAEYAPPGKQPKAKPGKPPKPTR